MLEKCIFEIPIYIGSQAQYHEETTKREQRVRREVEKWYPPIYKINKKDIDEVATRINLDKWLSWYYNQAVGFIRIYALKTQIRVEYFYIKEKVSKNVRKKSFVWAGKLFDTLISPSRKNEEITLLLTNALKKSVKEKLKYRFVDFESFETVAPHLDWQTLLSKI
jgi:hypothetical protein